VLIDWVIFRYSGGKLGRVSAHLSFVLTRTGMLDEELLGETGRWEALGLSGKEPEPMTILPFAAVLRRAIGEEVQKELFGAAEASESSETEGDLSCFAASTDCRGDCCAWCTWCT